MKTSYTCQLCGKTFSRKTPCAGRPRPKYCSRKCASAGTSTRVTLTCVQCGTTFQRKGYMANWSRERGPFCGFACYGKWQHIHNKGKGKKPVVVKCDACGKPIDKVPSSVYTHNFCSRVCFGKWKSFNRCGNKNPSWRGGHTAYRGENWGEQRKAALQRDSHQCRECGKKDSLAVHHIRPFHYWSHYIEANALDNLVTLCNVCHGVYEQRWYKEHPDLAADRCLPIVRKSVVCVRCGESFLPQSPRALFCDTCCTFRCKHCKQPFYSRRATQRTPQFCSRACRNAHVKTKWNVCPDCGGHKHFNAARCRHCDTAWYKDNPSAPRRGRKHQSTPL